MGILTRTVTKDQMLASIEAAKERLAATPATKQVIATRAALDRFGALWANGAEPTDEAIKQGLGEIADAL